MTFSAACMSQVPKRERLTHERRLRGQQGAGVAASPSARPFAARSGSADVRMLRATPGPQGRRPVPAGRSASGRPAPALEILGREAV